jgi:hypothetical protein
MARNTSSTTYDREFVSARDDDSGPELAGYRSTRSRVLDIHSLPEDPAPLFLSNDSDERIRRSFGSGRGRRKTAVVWPRLFKAGLFAATAAAIAFAILSIDNPLAFFANAKASLISSWADQSGATQQSNSQTTGLVLASAGPSIAQPTNMSAAPAAAKATPMRDDIALALKVAHQRQVETDQAPVTVAPTTRRLDAVEVASLLKRAKGLIAIGDIVPARLLLERAADAQEPTAALLLAQTYDPAVLGTADLRSITPDPARARDWYQKAARLGSGDARQRLAQMQN